MLPRRCAIALSLLCAISTARSAPTDDVAADGKAGTVRNACRFLVDVFSHRGGQRQQIDLNGTWAFRRDPDNRGRSRGWHEGKGEFAKAIQVPGAPQAQGIGKPTARQKTFFMEPFWMRRTFRLPQLRASQRMWLRIGGILPAAEVYLNAKYIGYTKSSRTQQRIDVTRFARPQADNLLAIKVCDFPEVRLDGIHEAGEFAKTWTGAYRPICCEIADRISVVDAYVRPKLASSSVQAHVVLTEPPTGPLRLALVVRDGARTIGQTAVPLPPRKTTARAEVRLREFTTWSPQHPKLYTLDLSIMKDDSADAVDRARIRFGMREIAARGTKLYLNGAPIFVRCFGDDQYYPETLCPPPDKDWFLARLRTARAYGINAVKGCVETIPQDCIEAADEAGIMVIQEMPFGLSGLRANRHTIGRKFRDYYTKELDGLIRQTRNHACVVAYSMSSELEFSRQTQASFDFFSRDLVRETRKLAPHALAIDCTGYLEAEYTKKGRRDTDFYASIMPTWVKKVLEEPAVKTDRRHPTILHEYNWWSCYPDPADKHKFAEAQLKPYWLDTLVETAKKNGQQALIPTYRRNSLRLQALCRKDGVEYARRNPDVEGFILWLLIDFGQYSEGLLDDFWNPKNVSAREFLESNGDTVVLLGKEGNRCLPLGSTSRIPLAVSHYGEDDLRGCTLRWETAGSPASLKGKLDVPELRRGELTEAGSAELDLPEAKAAYKFDLRVELRREGKTVNANGWSFWAFPKVDDVWRNVTAPRNIGKTVAGGTFLRLQSSDGSAIPPGVSAVIADSVDETLVDYVARGGRCLLFTRGAVIETTVRGPYADFRTIPWNAGNAGNLGTVISPHPALERFPHDGMCDLQFVWMIRGTLPMAFDPLRACGVEPIIRGIDHYIANRNNAYMLEFKVGRGKVLATCLGVLPKARERLEAGFLLQCLADYVRSPAFKPDASVPKAEFLKLFSKREKRAKTGGK